MFARRSLKASNLSAGTQSYAFQTAGALRCFIFIGNQTGGAINYTITDWFGGQGFNIVPATALGAGLFVQITLPNDNTVPPLPLPDSFEITVTNNAVIYVHIDYDAGG